MPELREPDDVTLPLFVYGLLKPGELAFALVKPFVVAHEPATAPGTLWLRDGLPLFDPSGQQEVVGALLHFDTARLNNAWSLISSFEPAAQYKWAKVEARVEAGRVAAHVLEGKKLTTGTTTEDVNIWSAGSDPVFTEGLAEVQRLVEDAAPNGVPAQPDTRELWRTFFQLQAAYLLLWSVVERYTAKGYPSEPTILVG